MAAAQADDFALDWDLPEYPQLPKMFTSAKAAKKRKHKEFILTDADLDTVVKIPKAGAAGTTPKKTLEAAASKQTDPDAPAAAAAESLSTKAEHKRQKREAKLLAAQQAAGSAGASSREGEAASLPAEPARKKKKKSSTAQEQQQQEQGAPGEAAAQQLDDSTGAGLPKKSRKNKFTTQEFLQQQQQQQQEQQQQADLLHEQQQAPKKRKAATQQDLAPQHQQQQQPSPEQPSSLSKKQKQKLKKTQQQQQQQLANGNGSKAAAAPVAAAAAATKAPSHKERSSPAAAPAAGGSAGGSKLLQQFKERLQGSRFRQLNEALYTQPGDASFSTMQQQPQLFEQYHEGFQQQVKAWPSQPLDAAIKWLGPKPSDWVVADFGCGEARLAATVQQTVHSLDLVAVAPGVIECNMAHTPLETGSCDVAVFSLALMGTDYGSFLLEASRVLKPGGWLWVAEVRSRFADGKSGKEDFRPLLAALKALGFRLVQQDAANRMFVVWVLQMKGDAGKQSAAGAIKWPPLRACVYKKR